MHRMDSRCILELRADSRVPYRVELRLMCGPVSRTPPAVSTKSSGGCPLDHSNSMSTPEPQLRGCQSLGRSFPNEPSFVASVRQLERSQVSASHQDGRQELNLGQDDCIHPSLRKDNTPSPPMAAGIGCLFLTELETRLLTNPTNHERASIEFRVKLGAWPLSPSFPGGCVSKLQLFVPVGQLGCL